MTLKTVGCKAGVVLSVFPLRRAEEAHQHKMDFYYYRMLRVSKLH